MISPRQKLPGLRGPGLVSAAALLLVAGIVQVKTQSVLARPDENQPAAMTAVSADAVNSPLPPPPSWAVYNYVSELRSSFTGNGRATASLANAQVRMQMNSASDSGFDTFRYLMLTMGRLHVQGLEFTRPLVSQAQLSFDSSRCGAFGRTVPPAPVAYDLQKNGQIDLWDIMTAAECWQNLHTRVQGPGREN